MADEVISVIGCLLALQNLQKNSPLIMFLGRMFQRKRENISEKKAESRGTISQFY